MAAAAAAAAAAALTPPPTPREEERPPPPREERAREEALPKRSEGFYRGLWTLAHRVVEPRTLGNTLKAYASSFRDCVVAYDLKKTRKVALTIDDAPSVPELMDATLNVLKRHSARATFFVVEDFARKSPDRFESLRRCVGEGHELGNHLVRDESAFMLGEAEFRRDLEKCEDCIRECGGFLKRGTTASGDPPRRWFRPPHGYMSGHMARTLRRKHYSTVLADVFPLDTEVRSVEWIVHFILRHVKNGSIILLHAPDVRRTWARSHKRQNNVAVLESLLPQLHDLGFDVCSLSELADAFDEEQLEEQQCPAAGDLAAAAVAEETTTSRTTEEEKDDDDDDPGAGVVGPAAPPGSSSESSSSSSARRRRRQEEGGGVSSSDD
mmetsp:Transcript_19883/g.64000  ORF Transcript_19883/g.64000 Transcript_19883/m.64000 type:complete len:381 (-) Transcript_19883:1563-2705(-)